MKLEEHQTGVLLMIAGLSGRADGAAIMPAALKSWIADDAVIGTIDRETLWLFRTGYITTNDGSAYFLTNSGWAALDQHMLEEEAAAQTEKEAEGDTSPPEPILPAKQEEPDVLILMGEFFIKAEAQRMTSALFHQIKRPTR